MWVGVQSMPLHLPRSSVIGRRDDKAQLETLVDERCNYDNSSILPL